MKLGWFFSSSFLLLTGRMALMVPAAAFAAAAADDDHDGSTGGGGMLLRGLSQGQWKIITHDGFEKGLGNFERVEGDCGSGESGHLGFLHNCNLISKKQYVYEGDKALQLIHRGAVQHKNNHDLRGITALRLHFWAKTRRFEDNDKLVIHYSSNGGTDWENVYQDKLEGRKKRTIDLDTSNVNLNTRRGRIRIGLVADRVEKVYFDEVSLEGYSVAVAPSATAQWVDIAFDDFEDGWGNFKKVENTGNSARIIDANSRFIPNGDSALILGKFDGQTEEGKSSVFLREGFDVGDCLNLRVTFSFLFRGLRIGNGVALEYSINDGSDWIAVATFMKQSRRENGKVYRRTVDFDVLPLWWRARNAKIRFRIIGEGTRDTKPKIYIDDVAFQCLSDDTTSTVTPTAAPTMSIAPSTSILPSASPSEALGKWETITYDDFEDFKENDYGNFVEDDNGFKNGIIARDNCYVPQGVYALKFEDLHENYLKDWQGVGQYDNVRVTFSMSARGSLGQNDKLELLYKDTDWENEQAKGEEGKGIMKEFTFGRKEDKYDLDTVYKNIVVDFKENGHNMTDFEKKMKIGFALEAGGKDKVYIDEVHFEGFTES